MFGEQKTKCGRIKFASIVCLNGDKRKTELGLGVSQEGTQDSKDLRFLTDRKGPGIMRKIIYEH
jgi:hypothetical protein